MSQSKALLYIRVSTKKQEVFGVSLDAQEAALIAEAERRNMPYEVIREEGKSGKTVYKRPELVKALEMLDKGEATHLIAHRLDRISRSVSDFSNLLSHSSRKGWALVVLDVDVDTSTPSGEFLVNVMVSVSQFERKIIGARTKEALGELKKQGVILGRPSTIKTETLHYIKSLRSKGFTLLQVAEQLNREQIKTAHNGLKWYASTISKALQSQALVNK